MVSNKWLNNSLYAININHASYRCRDSLATTPLSISLEKQIKFNPLLHHDAFEARKTAGKIRHRMDWDDSGVDLHQEHMLETSGW